MKSLTKTLFTLTLAGLLSAGLTGCAPATSPAADTGTKVRPYTTASADIGVGLTFEDGKALVAKDYGSDATVATDTATNGTWVLSMTSTGNYEGWEYTFATPVDFTTAKTLTLDLKAPTSGPKKDGTAAAGGTVIALLDANGAGYGIWKAGTDAWVTGNSFTVSKTGIVDKADATNNAWGWGSGTADMTKVVKLRITANEHKETILADNISLK